MRAKKVQDEYDTRAKEIREKSDDIAQRYKKDQYLLTKFEESLPALQAKIATLEKDLGKYQERADNQLDKLEKKVEKIEDYGLGKAIEVRPWGWLSRTLRDLTQVTEL